MTKRRKGRGSSMGKGARKSRAARQSGKTWLTVPSKWGYFKEEIDTTNKLDILPYIVKKMKKHPEYEAMQEDVWYRYPYKIHRNVGATRQAMLCPGTIGKPCPMCEKMQSIYDDPDINNKKAGKFRPSKRSLFIVKVKSGAKKFKKKKFIWDVSDANFFDHVDKEIDRGEEDWNNFACLEGGYTIKVRWDEASFDKTKFAEAGRIDFTPRKTYKEKLLDKNPCLDDIVVPNIPKYKEIKEAMKGGKADKKNKKNNKKNNKKKNRQKLDWDDLVDMDETELLEVMEDAGEDPNDLDYDDEKELRGLVADELDIDHDDDNDNDDNDNDNDDNDDDDNDDDDNDNDDNDDNDDDNDNNDDDDNDNDDNDKSLDEQVKSAKKLKELKSIVANNSEFKKIRKATKKLSKKKDFTGLKKKMMKLLKLSKKNSKKNKNCPFAYQYGKDWGDQDECNDTDCKKYNKCFKKYDKIQDDE